MLDHEIKFFGSLVADTPDSLNDPVDCFFLQRKLCQDFLVLHANCQCIDRCFVKLCNLKIGLFRLDDDCK
jgi:hypothetical protein